MVRCNMYNNTSIKIKGKNESVSEQICYTILIVVTVIIMKQTVMG